MSEDGGSTIENIPVPPCPPTSKSSKEILCELFSAFNAKPPVLDDIISQDTKSIVSDKSNKKHKKHTKKKHKKVKKRSRSSSSNSHNSVDLKKKSKSKKHKKHKSNQKTIDSNKKKKKSKLGKYSASDSSDDELERKKNNPIKQDKFFKSDVTSPINIKKEKQITNDFNSELNDTNSIQETILKHAVSKIVDTVIDSTVINTKVSSSKATNKFGDTSIKESSSGTLLAAIKKEPTFQRQPSSNVLESSFLSISLPEKTIFDKGMKSIDTNKAVDEHQSKQTPSVADVFAEDLLDNAIGTKIDNPMIKTDKKKPTMGKITIKNLKFSQVYEDTVKKIEEEAKLKAEKYEDGEISDSSAEQERSPTPSESGSVKEADSNDTRSSRRKKSHKHRRSRERHRHKRQDRKRSISRERYRSRSPSNRLYSHHHRERYKDRSRDRYRDRSRDLSRDGLREKTQIRSRSRSRDRERRRSRERASSRDRSKSEEKYKSKDGHDVNDRKRSHEKSKHNHGHSKDRDKRNSEEKIDKRKLLEIARRNALNMMKTPAGVTDQTKVMITAGGKTVNELTDFCKLLSKKDADGHESISSNTEHSSDSESEKPFHHPFQIRDRSNIVLNIRNSVPLPTKSHQEKTAEQSRQLRIQFPVSSGQQHRSTESEWVPVSPKRTESFTSVTTCTNTQVAIIKPTRPKRVFKDTPDPPDMDIGNVVSQRLEAMRRLQENPCDSEALSQMYKAQQNMKSWAESKQETGQFTGSTGVKVLSVSELSSGNHAWPRKDQLQAAAPLNSGMGMAMLQKMGWRPGEGLGKNKEGTLQPLLLEVKMDKRGLVAQEELAMKQHYHSLKGPTRRVTSLEGKHPVSLLNEYCSRRKYGPPLYELIDEAGPDHKKNFLFKVKVNSIEYKPAVGSPKKKTARAEAAEVCLKALGVLFNK